jgi:deoxyribose-phosphate aldolase
MAKLRTSDNLRSMTNIQAFPIRERGSAAVPDDHARNSGMAYDADIIDSLRVNRSAAERRVASLGGRRSVKKDVQAAWLLKAVTCIDLTTLAGDDTPGRVQRLCAKARQPVRRDLLDAMGMGDAGITTGAVCVYHNMIAPAVKALDGTSIPVAAVSTGFPAGLSPLETRLREIALSVAAGAREIDIVIDRGHVLTGNHRAVYDEMVQFREACGPAHVKAIIGVGDLGTLTNVARASFACMMAGADFIKTSTGKEPVNATPAFALVMARMIRAYHEMTGVRVGFKPAGGISTAKDALAYQIVMREELGARWLQPDLFRLGASSLLTDIERQLEHFVTGRYSAAHRHPMG